MVARLSEDPPPAPPAHHELRDRCVIRRGQHALFGHHCVHLRETTPLEADISHKYYAPDVGMIKDDEFELMENP